MIHRPHGCGLKLALVLTRRRTTTVLPSFSSGYGLPRFGHASGVATTQKIVSGTLIVDLMDAQTRSLVWRGSAERDLDPSAKPEKRDKNINNAAEKIFKQYPPKP